MKASTYTQALADAIVEWLSEGKPLREWCRQNGVSKSAVYAWRKANTGFDAAFLQARDEGYDEIADQCLRIADTPVEGIVEKLEMVEISNPDDPDAPPTTELQVTERRREDMLGHRKLQIDTRLKLLSKWDPRRYGDRLALANDREDPITGLTEEQITARLAELLKRGAGKSEEDQGDGHDSN